MLYNFYLCKISECVPFQTFKKIATFVDSQSWEIWKIRNKVKYNQSRIGDQTIFNTWKNNFKKHLHCTLQTSHINENGKNKLELFRNNI